MVLRIILPIIFVIVFSVQYASATSYNNEYYDNERVNFDISVAIGASGHGCEDTTKGCFIPKYSTVKVGQKIIFTNTDNTVHTFTAGTASRGPSRMFDSDLVTAGNSFEWIPTSTGVFQYHCKIHPWMTGVITVEGANKYDQNLEIIFIDLGTKGDSILITYPNGKNVLIDGGMASSYQKLQSTLKKYNVIDIDVLIATHPDEDHIGGLNKLFDDIDFNVHQVLVSTVNSSSETYSTFLTKIDDAGLVPQVVFDGYEIHVDELIPTEIISPSPNGLSDAPDATLTNTNALVTLLGYGDVSFLFNSDATFLTEKYIVENHPVDIDIMTSPHHGSKFSSTDKFLNMATPELVIVSANNGNQYGHPDTDVLKRYDSKGISHYQTGVAGTIVIKTDGVGCSILFDNGDELPCYDDIHMALEYKSNGVPFCKNRDMDEEDNNINCSGLLHISKNGYYDYKTGEIKSIIDPYGDGTGMVSVSKGLPRSIWLIEEWVVGLQDWYDSGMITPDEFDNALQYLIDQGIAKYQRI